MNACDYEAVVYGGGIYCVECLPDGITERSEDVSPIFADAEWDSFPHCEHCGRAHTYVSLTDYGVSYVLDSIRESLRQPAGERNRIMPAPGTGEESLTYWHGSRHVDIVREWAQAIDSYRLSDKDRRLVERFLDRTAN